MADWRAMGGPSPRLAWRLRGRPSVQPDLVAMAAERGLSRRLASVLAVRGYDTPESLAALLGRPVAGLHDPRLLPDAEVFEARIASARKRAERVLVFGDFDADGLTGLAILVLTLRRLGLDVAPYVPHRTDEGHGLSLAGVGAAARDRRSLVVTVDCGSSSAAEITAAREAGIDVLVTDHHRLPAELPPANALVNPQRTDSRYPDARLSGSGVAFKLAQLLVGDEALDLADLAAIGTVADVAPIVGENRAIVRLGLERLRTAPRPGLAALLRRAALDPARLELDDIAYAVAPRINAVGRVGDARRAAELLLSADAAEASALADEIDAANLLRRELLASALAEARDVAEAGGDGSAPLTVVAGPWPVGIVGLIAGRLADEHARPAVVFANGVEPWRGSARSAGGFDLAGSFAELADLFERFGGHAAAAGCDMRGDRYDEFRRRLTDLAGSLRPAAPELVIDLAIPAAAADYGLLRELTLLAPFGVGNPEPLVGVAGLEVARVRRTKGGHTQLVLRKGREVVDAICFGRDDLAEALVEDDRVDLVARLRSREFAGLESLQLEVEDLAPVGTLHRLAAATLVATAVTAADEGAIAARTS